MLFLANEPATDDAYMRRALREADQAAQMGEVPVGALVVFGGQVITATHNLRETTQDPCGHAELLAVQRAARALGRWRLWGCTVYVTLEPCAMCAGAMVNARIDRLVYGAHDAKAGAVASLYEICEDPRLNHRVQVQGGVLGQECGTALSSFFRARRGAKRRPKPA